MSELNELMSITSVTKRNDKINALRENGSYFEIGSFEVDSGFEYLGMGEWVATPGSLHHITNAIFKGVANQYRDADISSEIYSLIKEEKIKNVNVYFEYVSGFIRKIRATPIYLLNKDKSEIDAVINGLTALADITELKSHEFYNRISQLPIFLNKVVDVLDSHKTSQKTINEHFGLK